MYAYTLLFVLIMVAAYGIFEARALIMGPKIALYSPLPYETFENGAVTITGKIARISNLTLNGATLYYDKDGKFDTTLTYSVGGTILTLTGTDRFGRSKTLTRTVFVPATSTPLFNSSFNKN